MNKTNFWEILAAIATVAASIIAFYAVSQTNKQFEASQKFIEQQKIETINSNRPILIVNETQSYCKEKNLLFDIILLNSGKRQADSISYESILVELRDEENPEITHRKRRIKTNPLLPNEKINLYVSTPEVNFDAEHIIRFEIKYFDLELKEWSNSHWYFRWLNCKEDEDCELEDPLIDNIDYIENFIFKE